MIRNWFIVLILASFSVAAAQTSAPVVPPAATEPAAAALPDATTPKGALRLLMLATSAGDEKTIRSLLYTSAPLEEKLADAMADMSSAVAQLRKASKDAFGVEKTNAVLGDSEGSAKANDEMLAKKIETITGDTAVIELQSPNGPTPVELKKIGDTWKFRVGKSLENAKPEDVERQLAVAGIQVKVFRDLATDVAAGKFKSIDDMKQSRDARVRAAVMQYVQDLTKAATQPATSPAVKP